ncbi:MAG: sialidase family protein [Eubacteriales bacterium]|nr:sialidase family protein [Eubacteriales bacterium]
MEAKRVSNAGATAGIIIPALDNGLLLMYSTNDGKVFKKSYDLGETFIEEWIVPLGKFTCNSNLLRLNDGSIMMTIKKQSPDENIRKIGGADFEGVFSVDDGRTFDNPVRINRNTGCYYLMNARIVKLKNGRIIVPVAYVPDDYVTKGLETCGWCGCFYSDDEGLSWNESDYVKGTTTIDEHLAEPMVVENDDGTLKMLMRTTMGYLYESISQDKGLTWGREKATALRSPCAPFTFTRDPYNGYYVVVWDNTFPSTIHQLPRCPICIAYSKDSVEWENITDVANDPMRSYGYPMAYFTENEILLTYYEFSKRGGWDLTQMFLMMKKIGKKDLYK